MKYLKLYIRNFYKIIFLAILFTTNSKAMYARLASAAKAKTHKIANTYRVFSKKNQDRMLGNTQQYNSKNNKYFALAAMGLLGSSLTYWNYKENEYKNKILREYEEDQLLKLKYQERLSTLNENFWFLAK